jgi:hypothetical protein
VTAGEAGADHICKPRVSAAAVTAPWGAAIADAEEPASLAEAARAELAELWTDLEREMRHAWNGKWSMGCENRVRRIVTLSRLVGAIGWGQVPTVLLLNGTWQGIMNDAGLAGERPGPADLEHIAMRVRRTAP